MRARLLLIGTTVALGSALLSAKPAAAQQVCEVNGTSATAGNASGIDSLACGTNSNASNSNATAIGAFSLASGNRSTAVGAGSTADAAHSTALGVISIASGLDSVAVGYFAWVENAGADGIAIGEHSHVESFAAIAIGGDSDGDLVGARASGDFAVVIGADSLGGAEAIAIGPAVQANAYGVAVGTNTQAGTFSTAIGGLATAVPDGATALGYGADALAANSVAIGSNSIADQADTVSIGSEGFERRIVNLAAGVNATDAANVGQLQAVSGDVSSLQTTTATHTTQITAIHAVNATQSTQITAIQAVNATQSTQIAALETANASFSSDIDTLFDLRRSDRRDMKQGVASAMAMASAPIPSEPGRIAYAVNGATFRGEYALGGSVSYRLNTDAPFSVNVGFSYAGNKNNGVRVGIAGEF